ncbi:MAG: PHP domain-containing protein, partial [Acetobacterales bacterium]
MALADFVHLRVHTAYSLSEGALKLDPLADLCRDLNMPAVAMTDSGNLFGAMEFSLACAKRGVQPIVGCQLFLRRESSDVDHTGPARSLPPDQLVLLVTSLQGYWNLVDLVSRAFLDTEPPETPQIGLDAVEKRSEGLICLTGGPSGPI